MKSRKRAQRGVSDVNSACDFAADPAPRRDESGQILLSLILEYLGLD